MSVAGYRDVVTVWPRTGEDFMGAPTFGAPYTIRGKWTDEQVKFNTPEGDEVTSQATVRCQEYGTRRIAPEDYIAREDYTDVLSPLSTDLGSQAWEVRGVGRATDLRRARTRTRIYV